MLEQNLSANIDKVLKKNKKIRKLVNSLFSYLKSVDTFFTIYILSARQQVYRKKATASIQKEPKTLGVSKSG